MVFLAFIAKIFIDFPCRMDGPVAGQLGGTRDTGGWLTPILLTVAGDLLQIESPIYSKQHWKYDKIHLFEMDFL